MKASRSSESVRILPLAIGSVATGAAVGALLLADSATETVARGMVVVYGVALMAVVVGYAGRFIRGEAWILALFLGGHLFWFGIPAVAVALSGDWFGEAAGYGLEPREVVAATAYISLFAAIPLTLYGVSASRRRRPSLDSDPPLETLKNLWLIIAILAAIGLTPVALVGGSLREIVDGILASRSSLKPWGGATLSSTPLYVIGRACLIASSGLGLLVAAARGPRQKRLLAAAVALVGAAVTYFDSGTRSWTIVLLLPPVMVVARPEVQKGRFRRWVVAAPLLTALLLWLSSMQMAFRTSGFARLSEAGLDGAIDNEYLTETGFAVKLVSEKIPYIRESVLLLFLTNPIPRVLWEGKPYSRVVQAYGLARRGRDEYLEYGASSLPSIVGQFYMSWGALGVIEISIVAGGILICLERRWGASSQVRLSQYLYAMVGVWLFVSFRAMLPGFHYPVVVTWAVLQAVRWRTRRTQGRRRGPRVLKEGA